MRLDLLDYDLPEELIARRPTAERDAARLLVVGPGCDGDVAHRRVADLPELLPAGALLVVNDTRVVPARLLGKKADTGGAVELLLVRPVAAREAPGARSNDTAATTASHPAATPNGTAGTNASDTAGTNASDTAGTNASDTAAAANDTAAAANATATAPNDTATAANDTAATATYLAMGRASKPLRPGTEVVFGDGALAARVEGRDGDEGLFVVTLRARDGDVAGALARVGHMPLPPYMRRPDDEEDRARYQTVYARVPGAIAAPTAGLHLTHALLDRLAERGIERAAVTLHVGLGTFQPVTAPDLDQHPMHAEPFVVPAATREAVARARDRGAPVVAVGTTVVRALESAADPERPGLVREAAGETRLLIQPGYAFRVVDRLLTNFHLPRSTLLALVFAFGGEAAVRRAYATAIAERYRFYSYGDAMLLRRAGEASR